jgi:hypothetical protein
MNSTKSKGLAFLREIIAGDLKGHVAVSKLFKGKESYRGRECWWHDLPVDKLNDRTCSEFHLLCEKPSGDDFYYFRIPSTFFEENIESLSLMKSGKRIWLHLSAEEDDMFHDLRGQGHLDFSRFLQN